MKGGKLFFMGVIFLAITHDYTLESQGGSGGHFVEVAPDPEIQAELFWRAPWHPGSSPDDSEAQPGWRIRDVCESILSNS